MTHSWKTKTWKDRGNILTNLIKTLKNGSTVQKILKTEDGVVKNPPSSVEDTGSILGQGTKIPHAAGQLSTSATVSEPRATTKSQCSNSNNKNRNPVMSPSCREEVLHNVEIYLQKM